MSTSPTRILILGAAGRDFHDFNVVYRDDPSVEVVAFTAAQIEGNPDGIPILPEAELEALCRAREVEKVVLAYSDLAHTEVMHLASRALAAGADFELLGPRRTMLRARLPVIAVSAVRTGCGKSQTTRWLAARLRECGWRPVVIRHPMPYGDLEAQAVQRFATRQDLAAAGCTLEEREEYEPHLDAGSVVFAGVDYVRILARAEAEADVLLWDGGNNDFPFLRPDLHVVLVDPLRPGHEESHHPGEAVLRMADVVVVAKVDVASAAEVARVEEAARRLNPRAAIVRAASPARLDDAAAVAGRRVVVVEDGPSLTHGGMAHGAGHAAARAAGAEIVDPRPYADPALAKVFARHPHLGAVLPAVGYTREQLAALERTLEAVPADVVVAGTPVDLAALVTIAKPIVRARYAYAEAGEPGLWSQVAARLAPGPEERRLEPPRRG
jgi:predicted GTPase